MVAGTEANSVVLDVSGVGYLVYVPSSVLASLPPVGGKAMLHTVMSVREDDITLYGFATPDERHAFQILTSVTGVGPKVALAMLSVYDTAELAGAISTNDTKSLTRIPGVGPKLAQRVCLELGERMAEMAFARRVDALASRQSPEQSAAFEDIIEALVNLGYGRSDSKRAAERAIAAATDKTNTPELIRVALNLLTTAR
jgi:Holliday junction DNA helicase RuvA